MEDAKHNRERQQAIKLDSIQHSAACIMATTILRLWPDVTLDIVPCTKERFYYDFELANHHFAPDDFPKIEDETKQF